MNNSVIKILAKALPGVEALSAAARDAVAKAAVAGIRLGLSQATIDERIRQILQAYAPVFAEAYSDAVGSAWVAAVRDVVALAPKTRPLESPLLPAPPGVPGINRGSEGVEEIRKRFPHASSAAARVLRKRMMTMPQLRALSDGAQGEGLRLAQREVEDEAKAVQQLVAKAIVEGTSARHFRAQVDEALGKGKLSPSYLDELLRTAVGRSAADARREVESRQVIRDLFPYKLYIWTHDTRTRDNHELLGSLGISGTGIYRIDDPFWDFFEPPWSWNCRCGTRLLTLQQAADLGVVEAQVWLKTGIPPEKPEWRLDYVRFRPDPEYFAA